MRLMIEAPLLRQEALPQDPYDRWLAPDGGLVAEFHLLPPAGYLVRFPGQADFCITPQTGEVTARPASPEAPVLSLYHNAIVPLVGNHRGGLFLHGSAVASAKGALAFMGLSRRGKTTLAGAFARAGNPFLTEDVLALERQDKGYLVMPQRPVLRLFADSAAALLGAARPAAPAGPAGPAEASKQEYAPGQALPHATDAARLAAIFLLGPGSAPTVRIARLGAAEALRSMMAHAFILDVNDQARLKAHFERLATLAETVECHALDYPRRFAQLPQVIAGVLQAVAAR